jgi:hypothetical protein
MKKLWLLSFIFILLTFNVNNSLNFNVLADYKPSANYSFYLAGRSPIYYDYLTIDNAGLGSIVSCNASMASIIKKHLDDIVGESISFEGKYSEVMGIIKTYNAQVVKAERIDGEIYTVYASTNAFLKCVYIDDYKVNMQIAYSDGIITVGTPLILGSY